MSTYKNPSGNKSNVIQIDGPAIREALQKGEFAIEELVGTDNPYQPQCYTNDYHKRLFQAINDVAAFWSKCVANAGTFISNFDNVALPNDFYDNYDDYDVKKS